MEPSKNVRQTAGERAADDETRSTGSAEGRGNTVTPEGQGVKQDQDEIKATPNQPSTRPRTDAGGRSSGQTGKREDRTSRGKNPDTGTLTDLGMPAETASEDLRKEMQDSLPGKMPLHIADATPSPPENGG